jgi:hypothetical protein
VREARKQTIQQVEQEMAAWGWVRTATYHGRGNQYWLYFRCEGVA